MPRTQAGGRGLRGVAQMNACLVSTLGLRVPYEKLVFLSGELYAVPSGPVHAFFPGLAPMPCSWLRPWAPCQEIDVVKPNPWTCARTHNYKLTSVVMTIEIM